MSDKEFDDLKEKLADPEYLEKFVTAAITMIIDGEKNDQS